MASKLKWGIVSTGRIAKAFAKGLAGSATGQLVAVGSRAQASADAFGAEFGIARCHGSYEALLADPEVQAVYIATPHPQHAEWAIKAAEAGKHILCEKPLAMNHSEAMAVAEAAVRHNVFLMEAFMYRCTPQTAKLVELIRGGAIGEVRVIQATFSFHADYSPESRVFRNALGGGGIMDVGCYCTSMARLIAGAALGRDFAEPLDVFGAGRLHPETGVDTYAVATLRFPGDIVAQLATGVELSQENVVRVFGSEGWILVPSPWFGARDGETATIQLHRRGAQAPEEIAIPFDRGIYSLEADTVAAHLAGREAPAMRRDDTLGNMKTLDRWRAAVGVVYEAEKPEHLALPFDRRPLRVRPGATIPAGRIAGVDKGISRLIMGAMAANSFHYACALYDDFFARGGTCFDTAYVYGGGNSERLLGEWVKRRGVRDRVVILTKGAHTPLCTPEWLTRQFMESLGRLQMDWVDIYMMHRDNLDVPVGEFVETMNEHVQAGRMRTFGVSNWTLARVDEANAYAAKHGLKGIAAVSNNFSLARMVDPVWAGTIAASDAASREWFARTQMPLMSWSSQARGFFARGNPADLSDPELARCWYSDDNFARLGRAAALARERGVEAIQIALAYVLAQPFPVYAMIGPQALAETRSCVAALDIRLTAAERRWLNLETDAR